MAFLSCFLHYDAIGKEVIIMTDTSIDLSTDTISNLFFEQIKHITLANASRSCLRCR